MEHFIVSARKYRPQNFADVIGQQSITNTLEKAIENNHLAQALLFTGPRGVGKTSCARILAKNINQQDAELSSDEDFAFNIFELDAASNNSVDDIRSLTDQVRIPPQTGKYKVYIIDEVHMLSQSAFNAFLKTLEEPPAHAIFILATTEKHKIIPTILSRCQIFDFKRIGVLDAKNYLKVICEKENITADDDALHIKRRAKNREVGGCTQCGERPRIGAIKLAYRLLHQNRQADGGDHHRRRLVAAGHVDADERWRGPGR